MSHTETSEIHRDIDELTRQLIRDGYDGPGLLQLVSDAWSPNGKLIAKRFAAAGLKESLERVGQDVARLQIGPIYLDGK